MGSFLKGILVGTASFCLGFAVLSVVLPSETGSPRASLLSEADGDASVSDQVQADGVAEEMETSGEAQPEPVSEEMPEGMSEGAQGVAVDETVAPVPTEQETMNALAEELMRDPATDDVVQPVVQPMAGAASTVSEPAQSEMPVEEVVEHDVPADTAAPVSEDPETDPETDMVEETSTLTTTVPDAVEGAAVEEQTVAESEQGETVMHDAAAIDESAQVSAEPQAEERDAPVLVARDEAPEAPILQVPPQMDAPEMEVSEPARPATESPEIQSSEPDASVADMPERPEVATLSDEDAALQPMPAAPSEMPREPVLTGVQPSVGVRRGGAPATLPPAQGFTREVFGITQGRLPTVGGRAEPDVQAAEADALDAQPAYVRNAALTNVAPDAPAIGVILIDVVAEDGDPPVAALSELGFPVSIAVDPMDPAAVARARAYRAAGHEVVLLAQGIPALATASDLEVTLDVWRSQFPQAVAIMDIPEGGIARNRTLSRDLTQMLGRDGVGVIAMRARVDALLSGARAADLPATSVYRWIDDGNQSVMTMRRLMDRAGFEAARRQGVLIVGHVDNATTLSVLEELHAQGDDARAALVPASAVLTFE